MSKRAAKNRVASLRVRLARTTIHWAFPAVALLGHSQRTAQAEGSTTSEGTVADEAASDGAEQRVYADAFLVWIYARPERDPAPIGYLRAGQSAALRSHEGHPAHQPVRKGCGKGWFAVEPAGFVCLDRHVSFSKTRYSQSLSRLAPQEGAYLFDYALSMGAPSYRRLPREDEWLRNELKFGSTRVRPLPPHWSGHEQLVGASLPDVGAPLPFLSDQGSVSRETETRLVRREVPFGSMLAISGAFEHLDRTFLQSADGTIVPADRMRMFHRSDFQGISLGRDHHLPLGWARRKTRLYSLNEADGCHEYVALSDQPSRGLLKPHGARLPVDCLQRTQEHVSQRQVLALSGNTVTIGATRFAEIQDTPNLWVPTSYLFLAEKKEPPRSVAKDGDKWLHFRIGQGTLVSYRGEKPVFATLASPGIGGVPPAGADPLSTRTTPVGTYRIQFKHTSDDMSPESGEHRSFWIADVPYAQYFAQPFAIHVAYWHESFGEPMSGGCINVSPRDGERLFSFTDPALPQGWYGVGSSKEFGLGTTLVIER